MRDRRFLAISLIMAMFGAAPSAAQDPPRHAERVEVTRVLVDARVIDARGEPVRGLSADDFHVRVDGRAARVESAQWVTGALAADAVQGTSSTSRAGRTAEGRLVVFVFQKSLEASRIVGFMRMLLDLRAFLDGFTSEDRIAVLSFDSHLRLWLDFTSDPDRVRQVLERNILFGGAVPLGAMEGPSLFDRLHPSKAKRVYTIESALEVLAGALEPLPGAKSVVLVGHGFGRLGLSGIVMENRYEDAREALQKARASVFSLDITTADYHSLEAGLKLIAEETGGFFERTHPFGERALTRLGAALAGHYVLLVDKPEGRPGRHRLEVRLRGRTGTVFARNSFVD